MLTPPVETVATLRRDLIDDNKLKGQEPVGLNNGAVEIVIELAAPGAQFHLELDHPDVGLGVQLGPEGLIIHYDLPDGKGAPRYIAVGAQPSTLRIFLDVGSIEVFADNGRWTGTKRLPGFATVSTARLSAPADNITAATIWQLEL